MFNPIEERCLVVDSPQGPQRVGKMWFPKGKTNAVIRRREEFRADKHIRCPIHLANKVHKGFKRDYLCHPKD